MERFAVEAACTLDTVSASIVTLLTTWPKVVSKTTFGSDVGAATAGDASEAGDGECSGDARYSS